MYESIVCNSIDRKYRRVICNTGASSPVLYLRAGGLGGDLLDSAHRDIVSTNQRLTHNSYLMLGCPKVQHNSHIESHVLRLRASKFAIIAVCLFTCTA